MHKKKGTKTVSDARKHQTVGNLKKYHVTQRERLQVEGLENKKGVAIEELSLNLY